MTVRMTSVERNADGNGFEITAVSDEDRKPFSMCFITPTESCLSEMDQLVDYIRQVNKPRFKLTLLRKQPPPIWFPDNAVLAINPNCRHIDRANELRSTFEYLTPALRDIMLSVDKIYAYRVLQINHDLQHGIPVNNITPRTPYDQYIIKRLKRLMFVP